MSNLHMIKSIIIVIMALIAVNVRAQEFDYKCFAGKLSNSSVKNIIEVRIGLADTIHGSSFIIFYDHKSKYLTDIECDKIHVGRCDLLDDSGSFEILSFSPDKISIQFNGKPALIQQNDVILPVLDSKSALKTPIRMSLMSRSKSECTYATLTPQVSSRDGNIYFYGNIKITNTGKDRSPILSSDNNLIAFIRSTDWLIPNDCSVFGNDGNEHADQIWIYDFKSKKERLLVSDDLTCSKGVVSIIDLKFSPDNKVLYFSTPLAATSNALRAINVDGTNQHFVAPINTFDVIQKGQYKGYLVISQHRYFIGGGSYDWYWLFTPQGKLEGAIGPELTPYLEKYLGLKK